MKTDLAHLKWKLPGMCSMSEEGQNNSTCHAEAEQSEVTVNNTIPEPNFTVEQIVVFEGDLRMGMTFTLIQIMLRGNDSTIPVVFQRRSHLLKVLPPVSNPVG